MKFLSSPLSRHNTLKFNRSKEWLSDSSTSATIPDIEDLVSMGRSHKVCPFYLSKDLSKVTG